MIGYVDDMDGGGFLDLFKGKKIHPQPQSPTPKKPEKKIAWTANSPSKLEEPKSENPNQSTKITDLPPVMLWEIIKNLDPDSLRHFYETNQGIRDAINENSPVYLAIRKYLSNEELFNKLSNELMQFLIRHQRLWVRVSNHTLFQVSFEEHRVITIQYSNSIFTDFAKDEVELLLKQKIQEKTIGKEVRKEVYKEDINGVTITYKYNFKQDNFKKAVGIATKIMILSAKRVIPFFLPIRKRSAVQFIPDHAKQDLEKFLTLSTFFREITANDDNQRGGGGKEYKVYKGNKYVVRVGSRGGKYIVVEGKKKYI